MAIALVQSTSKVVTGTASTTLAFGSNLGTGNFITTSQAGFAAGGGSPSAAPNTPTDTRGHTYQGARAAYAPINVSNQGRHFYVKSTTAGADTVTLGQAASGDFTMAIAEWSGGDATDPLGAAGEGNDNTGNGTAATAGTTGARANADELVLAWVSHTGADTTIAEALSLLAENEGGSTSMPLGVQYRIETVVTATNPGWTLGASRTWFAQVVTFKAAAGGGGGAGVPFFFQQDMLIGGMQAKTGGL